MGQAFTHSLVFCKKTTLEDLAKLAVKQPRRSLFQLIFKPKPSTLLSKALHRRCFLSFLPTFDEHLLKGTPINGCF